ncbi:MAG TPA: hypothetical protein VEY50_01465 [Lysobacter sp.]|nr:hypothetical protein [Lysobacter sp.]
MPPDPHRMQQLAQRVARARAAIAELRRQRADEWELTAVALRLWRSIVDLARGDERLRRYAFAEFDRMLQQERL